MDGRWLHPGAQNCFLHAHVRTLRAFLQPGGVRVDMATIGTVAAYVRFGVFSATCCTHDAGFKKAGARR